MPGLQILNARLDDSARVRAVPWYTACFGIGTGGSFAVMGIVLANADYRLAALIGSVGAFIAAFLVLFFVQPQASQSFSGTLKKGTHWICGLPFKNR